MTVKAKPLRVLFIGACFFLISVLQAQATEDYARKTGKGCIFCHQESTGGQLKTVGFAYIRNGYAYPISDRILHKAESLQKPFQKILRFIAGYIHLLAAVVFFGAIFYIHIFVKPMKLKGGIPKGERILGVSCMVTLALTGVYLTWLRIDKWEQLFNNTFGVMLFVKIVLFSVMVAIGIMAATVVHSKMKKDAQATPQHKPEGQVTRNTLRYFDGSSGKPAYIVCDDTVYDVSGSGKWKEGRHFGKHQAGADLTKELDGAPHGREVLDRISLVGNISETAGGPAAGVSRTQKVFVIMAYTNLVLIFLILICISVWRWDFPLRLMPEKRSEIIIGKNCITCHRVKTPGIYNDWERSVHAKVGVDCDKCHRANAEETILQSHLQYDKHAISAVVTPVNCRGCHPREAGQYAKSKHANTHEIMWKVDYWLNDGMNNQIERITGCYACHGTVVTMTDGRPREGTWPNVGVGRLNPDGSKGSCSSCHTRHRFSIEEARKPEACDQCHLGPDHPQIEIYNESKHGTIYHAEGHEWNWDPDGKRWRASQDFRAPTCAACHMSAGEGVEKTHDVTERLSWETQAPLTVRPNEFKPFPAATDWNAERRKMKKICLQCHSETWTEDHYRNFDKVVENYNDAYYKPIKAIMDELYQEGRLSKQTYFDEALEWEFYELWHHEGRRARMGASMMAPDYAWWHGFYELKHRFNHIVKAASALKEEEKSVLYDQFPGRLTP